MRQGAGALRKKRTHRGNRSVLDELSRLPRWARDLLHQLRELHEVHRRYAICALRWIASYLEQTWFPTVKTEVKEEPDDNNNGVANTWDERWHRT